MVYFYDKFAGEQSLVLQNDQFLHLKARRARAGERIDVRNLKDGASYLYEIAEISHKGAALNLVFKSSVFTPPHDFCIAWAVVESAVIEKSLPALNEMGVGRLALVYADLSQKNVRLDPQRMERILINSSQQCGRNSIMQIEVLGGSDELAQRYENVSLIDFGGKNIDIFGGEEIAFVGPEGGFSPREREKFKNAYALNSPYILRSNTALIATCSKLIF